MNTDNKLKQLLSVVIENYIDKGDPVGSKYLTTLEEIEYAPSTLRKYLNLLEQDGLVYQPYNSSGRIPTREGIESYLQDQMNTEHTSLAQFDFDTDLARKSLRYMVEKLGDMVDGVVA
jgi:heat-inducible transcriptional repressor